METENGNTEHPDWGKIIFVTLGGGLFAFLCIWQWWLAVIYFLVICYGVKRVGYSIIFLILAALTAAGFFGLFL